MFAQAQRRKRQWPTIVKAASLLATMALIAGCSQYVQTARSDAMVKTPAVAASMVDAVTSARHHYQRQASEWTNLLAKGTDKTQFHVHLNGYSDSAIKVQKDLAQIKHLMTQMRLPTQRVETLKSAHQNMVLHQFEAFNANYDKTGTNPLSRRQVEKAVQGLDAAFAADMEQFFAETVRL